MPANEPFFTIAVGFGVFVLASLLVRSNKISSSVSATAHPARAMQERRGRLLIIGSLAASLLVFFTTLWELIGN